MNACDEEKFRVVYNHEKQYSIWHINKQVPLGWLADEMNGSKTECLEYIKAIWTDMRPASLGKGLR